MRSSVTHPWCVCASCSRGLCAAFIGAAMLLTSSVWGQAPFPVEASAYIGLSGRTAVTGGEWQFYSHVQSDTTQNPHANPVALSGSIGGSQANGASSATLNAVASVQAGAGIMRARVNGSAASSWTRDIPFSEASLTGLNPRVGWKDAYYITGNPNDPRPGRPLIIHALLNVSGGMAGEVNPPPRVTETFENGAGVTLDLLITGRDEFNRNILAMQAPYSGPWAGGSFARLSKSTSPTSVPVESAGPVAIPLEMWVQEGLYSFLNFTMEIRGTAGSGGKTTLSRNETWSTSVMFDADYGHTITWGGITSVIDADSGVPMTGWSVTSASGVDYSAAVPEPGAMMALVVISGAALLKRRGSE
jgi:hypothetical protein